jgi:hypothetical protein
MWTTLAVVATLAALPALDASSLQLSNVRLTCGKHGPSRTGSPLVPGDCLGIAYDITGITVDPASGKVLYSTAMEITDKKGKVLFKQEPKPHEASNTLGGQSLPGFVHLDIGLEDKPGEYDVKLTVTDRVSKKTATLSQPFTVAEKAFAIVRLTTTSDNNGQNPVAVPGVGEALWLNFAIVHFPRDKEKKQPHITFQMQVFDENGKPTTAQPFAGEISDKVPLIAPAVYGQFFLALNRPGKFRVELKATCGICKKTAEFSFPLTVVAPK